MKRGHGKLDLHVFAGVSCSVQGNRVVRHRAGILAAVWMRLDAACWGIDARERQAYDPPRSHNRPAVWALVKGFSWQSGAAILIPRLWRSLEREWCADSSRPTLRPRERAVLHRGVRPRADA